MRKIVLVTLVVGLAAAAVAWAATTPSVQTGDATAVSSGGAILHGTVNPGGSATRYNFQYGPTPAYGAVSTTRTTGVGTTTDTVRIAVSGLSPGTAYHYRIEAVNALGAANGVDRTFTTTGHPPPGAVTAPPTGITRTIATLEGAVVTQGESTTSYFQYGTTPSYGLTTAVANVTAATTPTPVAYTLTGLAPGTTFHYRLVAAHPGFPTQYGADVAFTTIPINRWGARLIVRTSPRRDRHRPFVFTTSGAVVPRIALPPGVGCSGVVNVRYMLGRRTVAFRKAGVAGNCAFVAGVSFRHRIDRAAQRLTVRVHFGGNAYLKSVNGRSARVTVG